ncbi:hypothetical protein PAPYR_10107 [Paratrimastix pyriformis]|uniref:ENTH domain-containing protein n=1 Tax=Paratrimastix pyriformis TaxID=342808 RepID=A0ABQ8U8F8_9EUKA|nr:hypothetical protein PAPYR_10107 [Paratrimastix pyriformis]
MVQTHHHGNSPGHGFKKTKWNWYDGAQVAKRVLEDPDPNIIELSKKLYQMGSLLNAKPATRTIFRQDGGIQKIFLILQSVKDTRFRHLPSLMLWHSATRLLVKFCKGDPFNRACCVQLGLGELLDEIFENPFPPSTSFFVDFPTKRTFTHPFIRTSLSSTTPSSSTSLTPFSLPPDCRAESENFRSRTGTLRFTRALLTPPPQPAADIPRAISAARLSGRWRNCTRAMHTLRRMAKNEPASVSAAVEHATRFDQSKTRKAQQAAVDADTYGGAGSQEYDRRGRELWSEDVVHALQLVTDLFQSAPLADALIGRQIPTMMRDRLAAHPSGAVRQWAQVVDTTARQYLESRVHQEALRQSTPHLPRRVDITHGWRGEIHTERQSGRVDIPGRRPFLQPTPVPQPPPPPLPSPLTWATVAAPSPSSPPRRLEFPPAAALPPLSLADLRGSVTMAPSPYSPVAMSFRAPDEG